MPALWSINFRAEHRGDPQLSRSAVDAPAQFPGHVPGKAGPAPGSTSKPPKVSNWAAVSTPKCLSASPDTPSRALCPCIALLGYARRGLSAVSHTAYHASSDPGACASCPRRHGLACLRAGRDAGNSNVHSLYAIDFCSSFVVCVAMPSNTTRHSLSVTHGSRCACLCPFALLLEVCLAHWAWLSLSCRLKSEHAQLAYVVVAHARAPARQSVAWPVGHSPGGASTVTWL